MSHDVGHQLDVIITRKFAGNVTAGAEAIMTMAEAESGNRIEAEQHLAHATSMSRAELLQTNECDLGEDWPEWLATQLMLQEAESTIPNQPSKL
jgi:hypothetical protein